MQLENLRTKYTQSQKQLKDVLEAVERECGAIEKERKMLEQMHEKEHSKNEVRLLGFCKAVLLGCVSVFGGRVSPAGAADASTQRNDRVHLALHRAVLLPRA